MVALFSKFCHIDSGLCFAAQQNYSTFLINFWKKFRRIISEKNTKVRKSLEKSLMIEKKRIFSHS